jgi:hypothetical protein
MDKLPAIGFIEWVLPVGLAAIAVIAFCNILAQHFAGHPFADGYLGLMTGNPNNN